MQKTLLISALMATSLISSSAMAETLFVPQAMPEAPMFFDSISGQEGVLIANIAINTAPIDGSVVIKGNRDISIGGTEAVLATDLKVEVGFNGTLPSEANVNVNLDLSPELSAQVGSSIHTSAFGAANMVDVTVKAAQTTLEADEMVGFDVMLEQRDLAIQEDVVELDAGFLALDYRIMESMTINKAPEISILNVAYNADSIDASVKIGSNITNNIDLENFAISTSALGALNSGTMEAIIGKAMLPKPQGGHME